MSVATECLLAALSDAGIDCTHLDIADRRNFANMNRIDLGNLRLAALGGVEFLQKMHSFRPNVVYLPVAQTTLGFLRDAVFLVPARLARKKVVVHLHGCQLDTFFQGAPTWMRWLMKWTLGQVRIAVVLGEGGESQFRGLVPDGKVRVVPNGLPVTPCPSVRSPSPDVLTILYLSTLMREKGILDLLEATAQLGDEACRLRLVFAGDWYSKEDERQFLVKLDVLGLRSRVELRGPVQGADKDRTLAEADVFVLAPRHVEGLPFAILEAMRAGLPVITSDSGFIPQVIESGQCGLVVPRGDVPALADAMGTLARDSELRSKMGHAARQRFLAEYTLERWSTRMLAVFQEVAEQGQV